MALPVPANNLMSQPMVYPPAGFTPLPSVYLPEEVRQIYPALVTAFVNEVSQKANLNSARIFLYNLLSQGGWSNGWMQDAVEFLVGLATLRIRQGQYRSLDELIGQCATDAATLLSSRYILEYPELAQMCQPFIVQAAQENYQTYQQIRQAINQQLSQSMAGAMMGGGGSGYARTIPVANYGGGGPVPVQYAQGGGFFGGYGSGAPYGAQGYGPQSYGPQGYGAQGYGGIQMPTANAPAPTLGAFNQPRSERFNDAPIPQVDRRAAPAPVHTPTTAKEKPTTLVKPLKEIEVDRNKHRIALMSTGYELERYQRIKRMQQDIALATPDEERYVYPNVLMTTGLESLIFEARLTREQKRQEGRNPTMYHTLGIDATAVLGRESYQEIIDRIVGHDDLNAMCGEWASITEALKQASSSEEKKFEMLDALQSFDRIATQVLKRYIRYSLGVKIDFDSALADGVDLGRLIEKKDPALFARYEVYRKRFGTLFRFGEEQCREELTRVLVDETGLAVTLIARRVSITFVDLYEEEFGFRFDEGYYRIDEAQHAELSEAIAFIEEVAKSRSWASSADYLVTRDGSILLLMREEGNYLIHRLVREV